MTAVDDRQETRQEDLRAGRAAGFGTRLRGRWRARRRPRRSWLLVAVLLVALLVASVAVLSWPAPRSRSGGGSSEAAAPYYSSAPSAAPRAGDSGGTADRAAAPMTVPDRGTPNQVPSVPVGATERQLVRTAQLTVDVGDAAAAVRQVRTAATAAGGLVVEEQTSDRRSSLTLRVPAAALDRVIDDVAAVGTVTARNSQVVDSTADVVDLDARVASQQASVARVRALLAQATSIGDVVAIESELARREAELDSLTNRLAVLRDQVAMSTLTVSLYGPGTVASDEPDVRAVGFADGLDAGWRGLVALGTAAAAVLGFVLPFLPVLVVLFGLGWAARRVLRRRRPAAVAGPAGTGGSATS